ncbi:PadR family transcriptional regulator [Nonomuraea jiangxiensis]|uniref:PadR family transcriptional regulator n=1 Tax=Nonomuraea jiangxiensis TaxID=633440 RepID=UPI000B898A04|nr:helix-turn-helix transcriptional regulator [Nonomuraea jiangxiensis]
MDSRALSLTEWVVLALVAETPTHGFAVSRLTGDTGPVGAIWQIRRPHVYRALDRLAHLSLVEQSGRQPGRGGPQRTVFAVTASGRAAVDDWLMRPVEHIRDIRTEFLIKLAVLERARTDPRPLLDAQAERIEPIVAALRKQRDEARGFEHAVISWRYETAEAALRLTQTARR